MKTLVVVFINSVTDGIEKSHLTSLCQREEFPLFEKEGPGEICQDSPSSPQEILGPFLHLDEAKHKQKYVTVIVKKST